MQAGKDKEQNIWENLGRVMGAYGSKPPIREAHNLTVYPQAEYLPLVFDQLEARQIEQSEELGEEWCGYCSYSRKDDIERITLPGVLSALERFAAGGKIEDGMDAVFQTLDVLIREMLRRGALPVMYPVGLIPSTPVSDGPFPVVATFAEFGQ